MENSKGHNWDSIYYWELSAFFKIHIIKSLQGEIVEILSKAIGGQELLNVIFKVVYGWVVLDRAPTSSESLQYELPQQ